MCGVFYPEPVVSARLQTDLARKLSENYQVIVLRPHPTRPKGFAFPDYDYRNLPFDVIEFDSYVCPASSVVGRMRESISHGRWCAGYIRQHHEEIDLIYNDSWHLFGVYLVARAAQKYGIYHSCARCLPRVTSIQTARHRVAEMDSQAAAVSIRLLCIVTCHLCTDQFRENGRLSVGESSD